MTGAERQNLIRRYTACDVSWTDLRERGFDSYLDLLGALGSLGLRSSFAPMGGPKFRHGSAAGGNT